MLNTLLQRKGAVVHQESVTSPVLPAFRRKGITRKLVLGLAGVHSFQGRVFATLEVISGNPAERLYERLIFKVLWCRRRSSSACRHTLTSGRAPQGCHIRGARPSFDWQHRFEFEKRVSASPPGI